MNTGYNGVVEKEPFYRKDNKESKIKGILRFAYRASLLAAALAIPWLAFDRKSRKEILERAGYKCEWCGRDGLNDGWKLEAAHKDHDRRNPRYNHPDNGMCLCTECHFKQHLDIAHRTGWWDPVVLIFMRASNDGLHDKKWLRKHPEAREKAEKERERFRKEYKDKIPWELL